ncbi:MAG: ribosome maturation factor RimP [Desulfuromonadales bacterium]|nr:ribosome maturation factor RimP [Desulfuromonadales bacterium]MDT8423910.1 ribosome maturation factor RimP [Desulfuromonadales bacterium]
MVDLQKIEQLILPILSEKGLELVDLEFVREGHGWALRVFIDKDGGVNLDDCAETSYEISALFEVEDPIAPAYRLEVSSPGLDRPLKKDADYVRFTGQLVKILTQQGIDPDGRGYNRKTFIGKLLGLEGGVVSVEQQDKQGGIVTLSLSEIESARLEEDFSTGMSRQRTPSRTLQGDSENGGQP